MRTCLAILLATSLSYADVAAPAGVRLSFVRAENASACSSAQFLERELRQRMGRDPFAGDARQWIEGYIVKQGQAYEVQLFERDASGHTLGTRKLRQSTRHCQELDEAIVLAIALIIDPNVRLAPATSSDAPPLTLAASVANAPATAPGSDTRGASGATPPGSDTRGASGATAPGSDTRGASGATPPGSDTRGASGATAPGSGSDGSVGLAGAQGASAAPSPSEPSATPQAATPCPALPIVPARGASPKVSPRRGGSNAPTPVVESRDGPTGNDVRCAEPTRQSRLGLGRVAADAVVLSGAFPQLAVGVELTSQLALDAANRYALRLAAMYLPEQRDEGSVGELAYGLTALEAAFCANTASGRFLWHGCGGFALGAIHTVVRSPVPFEPGDRSWAAFRLDAGMALRVIGPIWLQGRLFGIALPRRWEFRIKHADAAPERAFLQSYVLPGAAVGLALHFD